MEQQELQLNHYLTLLWRDKWLILLTTVVVLVAVIIFISIQPDPIPSYLATATIKVEPVSSPVAIADPTSSPASDRGLNTQIQIMESRNIMERALAKLPADEAANSPGFVALQAAQLQGDINVRSIAETNLLEVRARATSSELAHAKANAVLEAYIDYVKEERTRAIEEALSDITAQLQSTTNPDGPNNNQLGALLPSLGSELAPIARSVEKSHQVAMELLDQQRGASPLLSINQEDPQIERVAAELTDISLDLQRIREELTETQQRAAIESGNTLSQEASQVGKTSADLDAIAVQLRDIRSRVQKIKPFQIFEAAASRADDARVALTSVPVELERVSSSTIDTAEDIDDINTYVKSVIDDLRSMSNQLRRASSSGVGLSQSEMVVLRGQVLSHSLGLERATVDLQDVLDLGDVRDIREIALAEGQINAAIEQIDLLEEDLSSRTDINSLNNDLTEVLNWVTESSRSLQTVSKSFLSIAAESGSQEEQDIALQASGEIENVALTLEVAAGRTRSLQSSLPDPLLQARLGTIAARLDATQEDAADASARLTAVTQGESPTTLEDSLGIVQGRVQKSADTLWTTLESLQPTNPVPSTVLDADSAVQTYTSTTNVTLSLDIASRQLLAIQRGNFDPLLSGELGALGDRLLLAHDSIRGISQRLSALISDDSTNSSSRALALAEARLESAASMMRSAVETTQMDMDGASNVLLRENASKFKEQTDIGAAILGLVVNDLTGIQSVASTPVRYGQLVVLVDGVRLAQQRANNLSAQLQRLLEGRGVRDFELQQLRADLELSLLQPQETGITMVDSAVLLRSSSGGSSIFSKVRIPLSAMAGFFLGSLGVLIKAQMNQSVSSLAQIRDRLGLTPLGVIPKVKARRNSILPLASSQDSPAFAEAMQLVCTGLSGPSVSGIHSFLVTSPSPGEGKTMVSVNLAHVLTQYGHRVLLVDANLRKPQVAEVLGLPQDVGLSTALTQQQNPVDYIVETASMAVLPGGESPLNPVELLSSPAMSLFLQQIQRKYDLVVIDCPPIVGFAETKALAKGVGGAVLVVKSGSTSFETVKESKEVLETEGVPLVGAVLNFASAEQCGHLRHEKYSLHPVHRKRLRFWPSRGNTES